MSRVEETVAQLNQDALYLICEGNEEQAKQMLNDCLQQAKVHSENVSNRPGCAPAPIPLSTVPLVGALGPEDDWEGYEGGYFKLYRFLFTLPTTGTCPWDAHSFNAFCAVVSYNLAMIYHHEGIVEGEFASLASAHSLYTFCGNMLVATRHSSVRGLVELGLALTNNMGHLCSYLGDGELLIKCRRELEVKLLGAQPDQGTAAFFRHSLSRAWGYTNGTGSQG